MLRKYYFIISLFVVLIAVGVCVIYYGPDKLNNTKAADRGSNISGNQAWSLGELTNVSTSSKIGSIAINNKFLGDPALVTSDQVSMTSTSGTGASLAMDGNSATAWGIQLTYNTQWSDCRTETGNELQVDFGVVRGVTDLGVTYGNTTGVCGRYSADGTNWTGLPGCLYGGTTHYDSPLMARYLQLGPGNAPVGEPCPIASINEVSIQAQDLARAVHKTGSTQIDGSEGATREFVKWNSFSVAHDIPSNTTVKYRFRTSPDAQSWTGWTGYQSGSVSLDGLVTSKSGDTQYKYLQVEATMENSDGSSTPAVDSYDVSYHNSIKPSKPTVATAVVQ